MHTLFAATCVSGNFSSAAAVMLWLVVLLRLTVRDDAEPKLLSLFEPANTVASSHDEIAMASGEWAPLGHTSCRRLPGGCTHRIIPSATAPSPDS